MLKHFFSRQARKPSGWFGRIVAKRLFDRGNNGLNTLMLDVMTLESGQDVLEIGFGCGSVIRYVADQVEDGTVQGIDFSDAMFHVASKRNARHIEAGRVSLTHGDFDSAAYPPSSFDTVCSANTIYFWPDPAATCARIHSVLRPGGRVVLAFVDKSKMDSMPLDMEIFRAVSCDTVKGLLKTVGFASIRVHALEDKSAGFCVVGEKKR